MKTFSKSILILFFLFTGKILFAQTISIEGEVLHPLKLSVKDIEKLHFSEVKAKDREGKEHTYKGTMLSNVLDSAGVTLGAQLRGESLAKFVSIKAVDGYEVVFSLAEVDPSLSSEQVFLATMVDGNPLPKGEGPFRIVLPQDKRPARWVREIATIQVKFAKD